MTAAPRRAEKQGRAERAQRRAARPDASVWVAASAGSGKTKVLTDRVLTLLLEGTPPARILCLTFTKAAAAEMSNRLADRLAAWAADSDAAVSDSLTSLLGRVPAAPEIEAARRLFAQVLDAPGGMKIQTIHAFCQALLARFPLEARIPPHFQVMDERSATELLEAAREAVIGRLVADDEGALAAAVAEITAHVQETAFADLMAELTRERGRFARLRRAWNGLDGLVAALYRALGLPPDGDPREILAEACRDEALDMIGLRLASAAMLAGGKRDRQRGAIIAAWLDDPARRAAGFSTYLTAFFTAAGEGEAFKTPIHKAALEAAPGSDRVLAWEAERLHEARAKLRGITVARATAAFLRLADGVLAAYARAKRARALLDYDDLILETRDLLRRSGVASWVLFKLDGGLDHVLIDEAQDTNPEQWEVVEALCREFFVGEGQRDCRRTVFAVGDAKQSIYSFQRADPDAFAEMRRRFAGRADDARQAFDVVDLEVSFRSSASVLRCVDAVFSHEPACDGVVFDGTALHHDPVRVGQAGLVELWPPADPLEDEGLEPWAPPVPGPALLDGAAARPPRARLAALIARKIWRWTRDPSQDPARDSAAADDPECWLASKGRRLRPSDILVLVRRRNAFVAELVRELKLLDVPVAGIDRMILTDQIVVMDLIALGRVLLLPDDDLTLATVLKGPLVGLDEDQLFRLAHGRQGSLWDALKTAARGDAAFAAALEMLLALMARADFVRPFELYSEVLGPRGGRRQLLARLGPDANDPIEEFLSAALVHEREHVATLEGFLHWLEIGGQEVKRDLEHGQDAVRVMTVHGAKGLQAPVVFLPDTLQAPQADRGLLWFDRLPGGDKPMVIWPLKQIYDADVTARARRSLRAAKLREYRRLLYVAMTRAEDRLYLCGWNTHKSAPRDCWYRLLEQAMPAIAEPLDFDFREDIAGGWAGPGWRLSAPQSAAPEAGDVTLEAAPPLETLPPWSFSAPPPEPVPPRPLVPSRPGEAEPAVQSPLGDGGDRRFRRGRLVHRLLQSLPDLAPESRAAAAERFLAQPALGLPADERRALIDECLGVLEEPAFAALFGPDSRAEVSLVGLAGDSRATRVVSGQIDRLVVRPELVQIVDFKTNRPAPLTEAGVPPLYLRQLAAYRAVLNDIFPGRTVRCLLLWTDGPRLMRISDAVIDGHVP